jgi:hypothetical protein
MNLITVRDRINEINNRYNGDNDCSPDYPTVNWTDRQLTDLIEALVAHIEDLNRRILVLEDAHPTKPSERI